MSDDRLSRADRLVAVASINDNLAIARRAFDAIEQHAARLRVASDRSGVPYATEAAQLASDLADRYPEDGDALRLAEYVQQVVRDHADG